MLYLITIKEGGSSIILLLYQTNCAPKLCFLTLLLATLQSNIISFKVFQFRKLQNNLPTHYRFSHYAFVFTFDAVLRCS